MSITFGIYDFFSYTVPGFLYIFTINKLLAILSLPHFSVENISLDIGFALIGVVSAYVVGALMDTFAYRWYLFFNFRKEKRKVERQAIEHIKKNYPNLKVEFDTKDRRILFSFVRHNNLELAENIDKFKAISIMLQNISFGLFLFSVVQIVELIRNSFSLTIFITIIASWIFSYVAITRSRLFNFWYWSGTFEQALHYGKSVKEMFGREKKEK